MDDRTQDPPTRADIEAPQGGTEHWAGKLAVPTARGVVLIAHDRIVRLEADGSYTVIHLAEDKPMIVSRNLGEVLAHLPAHRFFRCHHKHAVNLNLLSEAVQTDGARVIMANGHTVSVSRRRWPLLVAAIRRM